MQAALVPTLQGFAGNQNIRRTVGRIAKRGGKLAWTAAFRAIQARRRKRGKPILFSQMPKPIWQSGSRKGNGGNVVVQNRSVPVRIQNGSGGQSASERVAATEMTAITPPIPVNAETVDYYFVSPAKSELWPGLATKAKGFSRYCVDTITFCFTPVAGSAVNGTVYMAFTNDISQAHQGLSTQDMLGFPVFRSESVSTGFSMTVPASFMNKGTPAGQLNIDDYTFTSASGDGALVYAGVFLLGTRDLSVQSGTNLSQLGTIQVRYGVTLKMTQNPSLASEYQISFDAEGSPIPRRGNEIGVFNWGDDSVHLSSNRPINLVVRDTAPDTPAPDALAITWDGDVLTPILQVGTHNRITVFRLTPSLNSVLSWVINDPTLTFFGLTKTDSHDTLWEL